jgi:hypothetical protein
MAKPSTGRRQNTPEPRARRFPIQAAVRYRADDGRWRQGRTENISRNGLLLHAEEPINPDTPVEVVVELPPVVPGGPAATMVCRGRVSRTLDSIGVCDIVVALAITHCHIGRVEMDAADPFDS